MTFRMFVGLEKLLTSIGCRVVAGYVPVKMLALRDLKVKIFSVTSQGENNVVEEKDKSLLYLQKNIP